MTNTPPPALANAAPYESVFVSTTLHPSLELAWYEQSVEAVWDVLTCVPPGVVQPGSVCSPIWLFVTRLTPSKVSISL